MGFMKPSSFTNNSGKIYTIRTASAEDAEKVLCYSRAIISEAPYLLTAESEFDMSNKQQKQFLQQIYEDPGKLAMIAEYYGDVIGFLDFQNGHKKKIKHQGSFGMSVDKKFRNQGIGQAMLTLLLAWTKENPLIERVCLEVFSENTEAISLYKKLGFVEEGCKVKAVKTEENVYHDLIFMAFFSK